MLPNFLLKVVCGHSIFAPFGNRRGGDGVNGQHFPLFHPQSAKVKSPQNFTREKWAAFPPILHLKGAKAQYGQYPSRILLEKNGQHLPLFYSNKCKGQAARFFFVEKMGSISPCFTSQNSAKVKRPQNILRKNGQHFPLFYSKMQRLTCQIFVSKQRRAASPPASSQKGAKVKCPPKKLPKKMGSISPGCTQEVRRSNGQFFR